MKGSVGSAGEGWRDWRRRGAAEAEIKAGGGRKFERGTQRLKPGALRDVGGSEKSRPRWGRRFKAILQPRDQQRAGEAALEGCRENQR